MYMVILNIMLVMNPCIANETASLSYLTMFRLLQCEIKQCQLKTISVTSFSMVLCCNITIPLSLKEWLYIWHIKVCLWFKKYWHGTMTCDVVYMNRLIA